MTHGAFDSMDPATRECLDAFYAGAASEGVDMFFCGTETTLAGIPAVPHTVHETLLAYLPPSALPSSASARPSEPGTTREMLASRSPSAFSRD